MKYEDLKPRQQEWIQKFYEGLQNEAIELATFDPAEALGVRDAYTRSYIRYMSSKYCDMEWGPAWIVKDKSRVPDDARIGVYLIPELQEYADLQDAEKAHRFLDHVLEGPEIPDEQDRAEMSMS